MKLNHVYKTYHNKNNNINALIDINLEIKNKGIVTIVGPSGSGKTSLLNIIAGVDNHFEGKTEIFEKVEIIEQNIILFESMSVIDNLLICGTKEKSIELLEKFDLKDQINKPVKHLSNGQKKRVQIIRSLLMEPDILLCDEPTASLDYDNKRIIMNLLKEISENCCVIVVTHELDIAHEYSDRMLTIDNGRLIDDQVINCKDKNVVKTKEIINRSFVENIGFFKKDLKSKKLYHIGSIVLIFFIIFSLFVSTNMLQTTQQEINKNMNSYYGTNIISLTPDEEYNEEENFSYLRYDDMTYSQIKELVSKNEEI